MVLDAHDVLTKPAERRAAQTRGIGGVGAKLRYLLMREMEKRVMRRFDAVVTLSDHDRHYLLAMLPGIDVRTVPIPAGLDFTGRTFTRRQNDILFLASFRYRPTNVRGALWFCREVFPLVQREIPDARFVIAGYGPPPELTALAADPQVAVIGYVDDLEACHKEAAVFAAPILEGGGIIVKVLDALAAGTPVVTTTYGNEGIDGVPGRDLLVADDPQAFAEAVILLLRDREKAERIGASGRAYVAEHYGLEAVVVKFESLYGEIKAMVTN